MTSGISEYPYNLPRSYPASTKNSLQKFWSSYSLAPLNMSALGKTLWSFRTFMVKADKVFFFFTVGLIYIFLIGIGFFGNFEFFVLWLSFIVILPLLLVVSAMFWLGKKSIYFRTIEGTNAYKKMVSSSRVDVLSPRTLQKYIQELILLDNQLAEVLESSLELDKAIDALPNTSNLDELATLSISVEAAEKELDINNVSQLIEELKEENSNLLEVRKMLTQKMEKKVIQALEGYDVDNIFLQKEKAEKTVAKARDIREKIR